MLAARCLLFAAVCTGTELLFFFFNLKWTVTVVGYRNETFIGLRVDYMGERGRKGAGSAQEAPATDAWSRRAATQPAGYPNTQPGGRTAGECPPPASPFKPLTLTL